MTLNEVMTQTADAIREKTGKSEKIAPVNFAEEIKGITAVVALVGAFCCAYYLPYPLNLITAFACCVPSGIIIRKVAIKAMTKKGEGKSNRQNRDRDMKKYW